MDREAPTCKVYRQSVAESCTDEGRQWWAPGCSWCGEYRGGRDRRRQRRRRAGVGSELFHRRAEIEFVRPGAFRLQVEGEISLGDGVGVNLGAGRVAAHLAV